DAGFASRLLLFENLVLSRAEITRVCVERLQQAMERTAGHRAHVRLFHILGADAVQHLAINLHVGISAVSVDAASGGMDSKTADHGKHDDDKGTGEKKNLQFFGH